jgi:hypothetical protein
MQFMANTEALLQKQLSLGTSSGSYFALTVTSGSSTHTSLVASTYFAMREAITGSRVITIKAEGDVWYRFSTAASGETVDENEVTGSNMCGILFAGERDDIVLPVGTNGIVHKSPVTTKLRFWISS